MLAQVLFEVLVTVWAHFCKNDGRAICCEIDGQVLNHMLFGVLVQVLLWGVVWVAVVGMGAFLRH